MVALAAAGWHTRLLMRREPDEARWRNLRSQVVVGSLDDPAALERLVDGADAMIHVAGVIKVAQRSEFFRVNRDAAARLTETAQRIAPEAHFLLVSSLVACDPQLSN